MARRSIEMFEYRQALMRLRQGDAEREIARSKLVGREPRPSNGSTRCPRIIIDTPSAPSRLFAGGPWDFFRFELIIT